VVESYTQGTLVTANSRLSRQLRLDYDAERRQQGLRVWETADILPRGAWLARMWQECAWRDPFNAPVLLSPEQEEVLWEQAITESDANHVLLDLPATVSAAAEAWSLLHASEAPRDAAEFHGLPDPGAFWGWMHVVERKLRDNGWITTSQLPRALHDQVIAGTLLPGPLSHYGFDELTPADRRLFEACHAEAWMTAPALFERHQYRVGLRDSCEELNQAGAWARRKLEGKPNARIGIVVKGLAALSTPIERIFDDIFHPSLDFACPAASMMAFHISVGAASADIPMIAAALLILGMKSGLQIGEAGMLLRSPFLRLERLHASRLYSELRRQGIETISFDIEALRRGFPAMAEAANELRERQHPSEWSKAFSKLLGSAGWPGDRALTPSEHQTVEHWKGLLSQLAALDIVLPRITYGQALQRLREIAQDRRFAPRDEGAPVQVMDVLEAAGSRFDAVWIAGLHGGVWPEAPRPNPFLPLSLQRAAGMPHSSPERELNYSRRVTQRLLNSAPEVMCSYPLFAGEEKLRVSPLIEALPEISVSSAVCDTPLRRIFSAAVPLDQQPLGPAPPLQPGTLQRGGMNVLANQAACPFKAFAMYRLGARQYDAPDIGISPSERGTVAHKALELFWRDVGSQRELLARSAEEIAFVIDRCIDAALDSQLSRRYRNASLERSRALEQVRLRDLLNEWLEKERRRPDFTVAESEGQSNVNAGGLGLDVKVDRIDHLADGTHVILDYKTSDKININDWDGNRPDAPQLPLYTVKSGREVSGVYYAKLVPGQTALLGHRGDDLKQRLPNWIRVVDHLGASFLQGDASVDPKYGTKTCEFCDLHALCRIAEVRPIETAEDEPGE